MTSKLRIICICSGNICRSPMAVAHLRRRLADLDQPAVVISGGTLGIHGRRADPLARKIVRRSDPKAGAIIDEHRSQGLSPAMLQRADRLVIMSPRHRRFIEEHAPQVLPKVVELWQFTDEEPPIDRIPDPVGYDLQVFAKCHALTVDGLDAWLEQLLAHHS